MSEHGFEAGALALNRFNAQATMRIDVGYGKNTCKIGQGVKFFHSRHVYTNRKHCLDCILLGNFESQ